MVNSVGIDFAVKTLSINDLKEVLVISALCPSGQWQYGESCYKVVNTLTANWTNAREACGSQGDD
jgi:hypothetical protein